MAIFKVNFPGIDIFYALLYFQIDVGHWVNEQRIPVLFGYLQHIKYLTVDQKHFSKRDCIEYLCGIVCLMQSLKKCRRSIQWNTCEQNCGRLIGTFFVLALKKCMEQEEKIGKKKKVIMIHGYWLHSMSQFWFGW